MYAVVAGGRFFDIYIIYIIYIFIIYIFHHNPPTQEAAQ
jgi:hypothetical protein